MDIDFSLVITLLTLGTGLVWAVDAAFFAPRRKAALEAQGLSAEPDEDGKRPGEPWLVENCRAFFPVLAVVLVIRAWIVEPFQIPSGSMLPTLQVGDFILVNKYDYGLKLPVLQTKILDVGEPKRGDVVVFYNPQDNKTHFIKRVVGLPGDTIEIHNNTLWINGKRVEKRLLQAWPPESPQEIWYEENLEGVKHQIITRIPNQIAGDGTYVVPEGNYFMMGDNRDNSSDSRFIGFVPEKNLVGRAFFIWMHLEDLPSLPSFKRFGPIE
ncbi:MAG: signal peptidase I [Gammaproteobacteria bacterium]|nr:MAG: signal peptidase I [Gammaproteobacteria bacterium]